MIITDEIRDAIKKAVAIEGNPYRLSKKLPGIRHTTIRDWLSGKTKSISDENWSILYYALDDIFQNNGMAVPINSYYDNSSDFLDPSIDTLARKLSSIEQTRLKNCLKYIIEFKQKHPKNEIEFSFKASVFASDDESFQDVSFDSEWIYDISEESVARGFELAMVDEEKFNKAVAENKKKRNRLQK